MTTRIAVLIVGNLGNYKECLDNIRQQIVDAAKAAANVDIYMVTSLEDQSYEQTKLDLEQRLRHPIKFLKCYLAAENTTLHEYTLQLQRERMTGPQEKQNSMHQWVKMKDALVALQASGLEYTHIIRCRPDIRLSHAVDCNNLPESSTLILGYSDLFAFGSTAAMTKYCNDIDDHGTFPYGKFVDQVTLQGDPMIWTYSSETQLQKHLLEHGIRFVVLEDLHVWLDKGYIVHHLYRQNGAYQVENRVN